MVVAFSSLTLSSISSYHQVAGFITNEVGLEKRCTLDRWAHISPFSFYFAVEYWIYQTKGKAKIDLARIQKLESIGFEWDPQRAQWNTMYDKLKAFHGTHGHCKVPKGYSIDLELANWVRNQRLEYANMERGKKSRMTEDRLKLLNDLGFTWSNPVPVRKQTKAAKAKAVEQRIQEVTAAAEAAAAASEAASGTEERTMTTNAVADASTLTDADGEVIGQEAPV